MCPTIRIEAAAGSHAGCVRRKNEDSYAALPESGLFMVADGMGGRAGGEIASRIAIETVRACFDDDDPDEIATRSAPGVEPRSTASTQLLIRRTCSAHVQIVYPGDGFPSIELLRKRQELERRLEAEGAGEVTDAGAGGGVMDVFLATDDVRRAMPIVEKHVAELGLTDDTLIDTSPCVEVDDDEDEDSGD